MNARFQEIALLGRGGMGDVFLALSHDDGDPKLVVLKRLRTDIADDSEFRDMFLHEARLAMRLAHPNIVATHEVGQDDKSFFIAMEYLQGQSMYAVLRRARKLLGLQTAPPTAVGTQVPAFPLNMHIRIIADCLKGLHFAHELRSPDGEHMSLVHRDLSPANVFVTYSGSTKLLDFGIAKAADSQSHTRTGVIKGKIAYMAPERFKMRTLDRRSDVFSAGALLWEAAAGGRLWAGVKDMEIFSRVISGTIPKPSETNPAVHPRLEEICMRTLAVRPEDRYQTADELRVDLEDFLRLIGPVSEADLGTRVAGMFVKEQADVDKLVNLKLDASAAAQNAVVVAAAPLQATSGMNTSEREIPISRDAPPSSRMGVVPSRDAPPSYREPPISRDTPISMESAPTELARNPASAAAKGGTRVMAKPNFAPASTQNQTTIQSGSVQASGSTTKLLLALAIVLPIVAVGVTILVLGAKSPKPGPEIVPPPSVATTAATVTAPTAKVKMVRLHVQSTPPKARVYIDGDFVGPSPYDGELPDDNTSRTLKIEAKGFDSYSQLVTPKGSDITIQISLPKK